MPQTPLHIIALACAACGTAAARADINYSGGFATHDDLVTNGQAAFVLSGSNTVARLADNGAKEANSLFSSTKQDVSAFVAHFTFQITGDVVGDGFTFCIQNNAPTAVGANGGDLGYTGILHSIAFKFDIYGNYPGDPGTSSVGLFINGASPLGGIDPAPSGIDLYSKHIFDVTLASSGTTLDATITDLTSASHPSLVKSYSLNVPSTISSSSAYVGFTAGTGNARATMDVQSFTFAGVPEPTSLTLLALGLPCLLRRRLRR